MKAYARKIGLTGLAVARAEPLELAGERLRERIGKGFMGHYGFVEGAEDKFCHPERLLEGARSVLCCAMPYFRQSAIGQQNGASGEVARFARRRDYHKTLREKLEMVADKLRELVPGAEARALVDTGPLLDRAAASASGLGWYGRNACVFVEGFGSWVVLGEIVTDAELTPDPPMLEHRCGDCTLCMASCPTGAIVSEFEIDLNRCISHLTQMGGSIPVELRPKMGQMVYGCDICQEVCPQNYDVETAPEAGDAGLPGRLELIGLLEMRNSEYEQTLGRSAAAWIGRNRLRRNACVALGNLQDPEAVPALRKALLQDKSALVRGHAAWALGQIGGDAARHSLETAAKHETDVDVRAEVAAALERQQPIRLRASEPS